MIGTGIPAAAYCFRVFGILLSGFRHIAFGLSAQIDNIMRICYNTIWYGMRMASVPSLL